MKYKRGPKNFTSIVIPLTAITLVLVGVYFLQKIGNKAPWPCPSYIQPTFRPVSSELPRFGSWAKYTDQTSSSFSFEYPTFMGEIFDTSEYANSCSATGLQTTLFGRTKHEAKYAWNTRNSSGDVYIEIDGPSENVHIPTESYRSDNSELRGVLHKITRDAHKITVMENYYFEESVPESYNIYFEVGEKAYDIFIGMKASKDENKPIVKKTYDKIISTLTFMNK